MVVFEVSFYTKLNQVRVASQTEIKGKFFALVYQI